MTRLLRISSAADPTYPEVGGTLAGPLPAGYRHIQVDMALGNGKADFDRAAAGLRTWQAHRIPGVRVLPPDAPVETGTTVVVALGTRLGALGAPCRVVAVVEEPDRFGFAYGTLPGHPEEGEEAFVVTGEEDGTVRFRIRAFSRPGILATRLAGPLGRAVQGKATTGYLRALGRFVEEGRTG